MFWVFSYMYVWALQYGLWLTERSVQGKSPSPPLSPTPCLLVLRHGVRAPIPQTTGVLIGEEPPPGESI